MNLMNLKNVLYDRHFLARRRMLENSVGVETLGRKGGALRSRSGSIFIDGKVALVENEIVVWFNESFNKYLDDVKFKDSISFLKFLIKYPSFLDEIQERIRLGKLARTPHDRIIDRFFEEMKSKGWSVKRKAEVTGTSLGIQVPSLSERFQRVWGTYRGRISQEKTTYLGGDKIDLVCEKGKEVFIVEAKEKLTQQAIEQALRYKELYQIEHSEKIVKPGIVCQYANEKMLQQTKKYGIKEIFLID